MLLNWCLSIKQILNDYFLRLKTNYKNIAFEFDMKCNDLIKLRYWLDKSTARFFEFFPADANSWSGMGSRHACILVLGRLAYATSCIGHGMVRTGRPIFSQGVPCVEPNRIPWVTQTTTLCCQSPAVERLLRTARICVMHCNLKLHNKQVCPIYSLKLEQKCLNIF